LIMNGLRFLNVTIRGYSKRWLDMTESEIASLSEPIKSVTPEFFNLSLPLLAIQLYRHG
jgi:hypothetical protein